MNGDGIYTRWNVLQRIELSGNYWNIIFVTDSHFKYSLITFWRKKMSHVTDNTRMLIIYIYKRNITYRRTLWRWWTKGTRRKSRHLKIPKNDRLYSILYDIVIYVNTYIHVVMYDVDDWRENHKRGVVRSWCTVKARFSFSLEIVEIAGHRNERRKKKIWKIGAHGKIIYAECSR